MECLKFFYILLNRFNFSVKVTSVRVRPKATDITEFRSQGVIVGSVGLEKCSVVLTVVNRCRRGGIVLGASPLQ